MVTLRKLIHTKKGASPREPFLLWSPKSNLGSYLAQRDTKAHIKNNLKTSFLGTEFLKSSSLSQVDLSSQKANLGEIESFGGKFVSGKATWGALGKEKLTSTKVAFSKGSTNVSKTKSPPLGEEKNFYTAYSKLSEIKLITIGLASPEKIRQWAEKTLPNGKIIGEVTNANTLHHKTFKPQKGGLFCERIFGPLKDFSCSCGKVQKPTKQEKAAPPLASETNQSLLDEKTVLSSGNSPNQMAPLGGRKFCPVCDVEYTWSVIRRYQLGYIQLISPVTHIWYLKATPSYLSILLDMKKRHVEYVTYCTETLTLENTLRGNSGQQRKSSSELFEIWEKIMRSTQKEPFGSNKVTSLPLDKLVPGVKNLKTKSQRARISAAPKQNKNWYLFSYLLENTRKNNNQLTQRGASGKSSLKNLPLHGSSVLAKGTEGKKIVLLGKSILFYLQKSLFKNLKEQSEILTKSNNLSGLDSPPGKNHNPNNLKGTRFIKKLGTKLPIYFYIFFNLELSLQKSIFSHILLNGWKVFMNSCLKNTFYKVFLCWSVLNTFEPNSPNNNNDHRTLGKGVKPLEKLPKGGNKLTLPSLPREGADNFQNLKLAVYLKIKQFYKEMMLNLLKTNYLKSNNLNKENSLINLSLNHELTYLNIVTLYANQFIYFWGGNERYQKGGSNIEFETSQFLKTKYQNLYKSLSTATQDLLFKTIVSSNSVVNFNKLNNKNFGSKRGIDTAVLPMVPEAKKQLVFYKKKIQHLLNENANEWFNFLGLRSQSYFSEPGEGSPLVSHRGDYSTSLWALEGSLKNSYYNGEFSDFYFSHLLTGKQNSFSPSLREGSPEGGTKLNKVIFKLSKVSPSSLGRNENGTSLWEASNKKHKAKSGSVNLGTKTLPKLVNNFYILSHRQRWGADAASLQNWNYLNEYMCFFNNTTLVNSDNSAVDSTKTNSIGSSFSKGGRFSNTVNLYKPISFYQYRLSTDLSLGDSSFGFKGQNDDGGSLIAQIPSQLRNAFFSGPGMIQQLLNEFDFNEMKKMDKQNRIFLYQLNKTILSLRKEISLKSAKKELKEAIKKRDQLIRRTKLLRKLFRKDSDPRSMVLTIVPVLPPDLRPIVKIGGQIAASDLNRLYQRVIYRNDRLKKFLKDPATSSSFEMKYAQRLLQEAVDNLIQNGKSSTNTEKDARGRALKSLSELLKGKQGRFRQYLLGKRVDYSGRSVIVVGPKLKLHECGLPKEMALELYLPFLLKRILNQNLARTVAGAKDLLKNNPNLTWELLKEIMQTCPVLLNRAPTLHRLGIQAFQPKLIEGRAILLHPLVCSAFNADFDGDQMAVHVPITVEARAEAWKLMLARNNFLSPATGDPLSIPSQDMVLGCYYLTTNCNKKSIKTITGFNKLQQNSFFLDKERDLITNQNANLNANLRYLFYFSNLSDVLSAYYRHQIDLHSIVWVKYTGTIEFGQSNSAYDDPIELRLSANGNWQEIYKAQARTYDKDNTFVTQYMATTPGRILFNSIIQKWANDPGKSNLQLWGTNASNSALTQSLPKGSTSQKLATLNNGESNINQAVVLNQKDLEFLNVFNKQVTAKIWS